MAKCKGSLLLSMLLGLVLGGPGLSAKPRPGPLRVAVAANFKPVLDVLAEDYKQATGQRLVISSASSGVLYNQLSHGAPFDVFLSADQERPEALERDGKILQGSRQPYAHGRLVLWHKPRTGQDQPGDALSLNDLSRWQGRLAIANPATAPYGLAAQQVLEKLGLWQGFQGRLVHGASIQQAWQFVASGNVELGLVAWSQVLEEDRTSYRFIEESQHQPIVQELVILSHSKQTASAQQFVDFLLGPASQATIARMGYGMVDNGEG